MGSPRLSQAGSPEVGLYVIPSALSGICPQVPAVLGSPQDHTSAVVATHANSRPPGRLSVAVRLLRADGPG